VNRDWSLTENTGTIHMNTLRRADIESRFPGLLAAILAQQAPAAG